MANILKPGGLIPVNSPQGAVRTNPYSVEASLAENIFIGDPVVAAADGYVSLATAGAGNPVLGSVVAMFDANGLPVGYHPTGATTVYEAIVADDPAQEFVIAEDGDTSDLALADRGINIDLVAGTGSAVTNLSAWKIDSNTGGASANKQLRLIRKEDAPDNALGDYCRWIVQINNHQRGIGIVGVGVA